MAIGSRVNGSEPFKPELFKNLDPSLDQSALEAELIRSLSKPLLKPYGFSELERQADGPLRALPPDALGALDKAAADPSQICTFSTGVAAVYPTLRRPEQELIARFFVYSFASN